MTDFQIQRGPSSLIFTAPGVVNPRLIIEEGCWYLCTDTAELYLGVEDNGELTLKQINGIHDIGESTTTEAFEELRADVDKIKEDLGNYATEQYVIDAIEANDSIAKKEEVLEVKTKLEDEIIPTLQETILPTVQELAEKAATQQWVKEQKYLTEHQSLEGLATEEFVVQKIAEAELADKDVDLTGYATTEDLAAVEAKIPSIEGLATEHFVNEAVSGIDHPTELYVVDFNAPNYASAVEAYNSGKLLLLTNAAPDVNSFAMMNYVSEKYIAFTKFLMSRSTTYGAFNTYYLRPDNTWEVAKEVRLNKVEANIDSDTKELTGITIGKEAYTFDNFVTNETLEQNYITQAEIANTYVTEEHISNTYITVQQAADTYATTEQIETKVTEVIKEKVETGDITVKADTISYGTW